MEKNNWSNMLERVQRVDPPPYLFTRIEARIARIGEEVPSRSWVASLAATMVVLLMVNTWMLTGGGQKADGVDQVASSLGMNASNQLYHE